MIRSCLVACLCFSIAAVALTACDMTVAGGGPDSTIQAGGQTCCDARDNVVDCASAATVALCSVGCAYVEPSEDTASCTSPTSGALFCDASDDVVTGGNDLVARCVFGCHLVGTTSAACCTSATDPACKAAAAKCTAGSARAGCTYTDAASGKAYIGQQTCQADGTYGGTCAACSTTVPPIGAETCTSPAPAGCTPTATMTCSYTVGGQSYHGQMTCQSDRTFNACAACPSGVTSVGGVACTKPSTGGGTCTNGTMHTCQYASGGQSYAGAKTCQNGSYGGCAACPSGTVSLDGIVCSFPPTGGGGCSTTQCSQGGTCYPLEEYNECCAAQRSHHVKRLRAADGACTYDVGACDQVEPASSCP